MNYRKELFSCICNGFDMTTALDQVMRHKVGGWTMEEIADLWAAALSISEDCWYCEREAGLASIALNWSDIVLKREYEKIFMHLVEDCGYDTNDLCDYLETCKSIGAMTELECAIYTAFVNDMY